MSGISLNLNQLLVNEPIPKGGERLGGDSLQSDSLKRQDAIEFYDQDYDRSSAVTDKRDTSDFGDVLKKQIDESGQETDKNSEESESNLNDQELSGQRIQKPGELKQKSENTDTVIAIINSEMGTISADTMVYSGSGSANLLRYGIAKSSENHAGIPNTPKNLLTRQNPADGIKQTNPVGQVAGNETASILTNGKASISDYIISGTNQDTAQIPSENALQQAQAAKSENQTTAGVLTAATSSKLPNEPILPPTTDDGKAFKQNMGQSDLAVSENRLKNNPFQVQKQTGENTSATTTTTAAAESHQTDSSTIYKSNETNELTQHASISEAKKMTIEAVGSLVKQPEMQTGSNSVSQNTTNSEVQAVEKQTSLSSIQNLFQKPIDQILNNIPTTITGSTQQIRVSLNPEELGAVRITFKQQDEQIEGLIEIQNNEVRKDIEKSIPQIAAALAESGVMVRRIDIAPMQNSSQPQNESFSQGFSAADQQHLAGQADYNSPRSSGSSSFSGSSTGQQSVATPSTGRGYDPNALNMYA